MAVDQAYLYAHFAVATLIEQSGQGAVSDFVGHISVGVPVAEALEKIGMPYKQLEETAKLLHPGLFE